MSHQINDEIIQELLERYPLTINITAVVDGYEIFNADADHLEAMDATGDALEAYKTFINVKYAEMPSHE